MTPTMKTRTDYIERLRDLLPYRDSARILEEVDGLLQDSMEAETESGASPNEAEARAVQALVPAEHLAEQLLAPAVRVDLATRRTSSRMLAVTFAVHLLLAIVLTVAGTGDAGIPSLLGPLPTSSLAAVFGGVLSIFFMDAGALFLLFALLGRGKAPSMIPTLKLHAPTNKRDSVFGLVLVALLALVFHVFRDAIFALQTPEGLVPILAPAVIELLPLLDLVLVLVAARLMLNLAPGREHVAGVALDALASLALAVFLVLVATRSELVVIPESTLGRQSATTFGGLLTRVLMLVSLAAALFLTVRFVKRVIRARQLLGQG